MGNNTILITDNLNMEENKDFDTEFRVRLPSILAERIAETAKIERRSKNQQYVFLLEDWFRSKDSLEKRVERLEEQTIKRTD